MSDQTWCWWTYFVDVGLLLIYTNVLSRLVEGISLSRRLSEVCLPGAVYAPCMQQHEQQVLEVTAQLMEVCHEAKRLSLFSTNATR